MHFKYDISRCDYHRYQFIHTLFALYTSAISCSSPFFTPTAFRFVYYFLSISSFIFDMLVICYATLFVLYIFAITVYEIIICYFVFCSNRAIFSHYCYSCIRTNWLHEFHFFSCWPTRNGFASVAYSFRFVSFFLSLWQIFSLFINRTNKLNRTNWECRWMKCLHNVNGRKCNYNNLVTVRYEKSIILGETYRNVRLYGLCQ